MEQDTHTHRANDTGYIYTHILQTAQDTHGTGFKHTYNPRTGTKHTHTHTHPANHTGHTHRHTHTHPSNGTRFKHTHNPRPGTKYTFTHIPCKLHRIHRQAHTPILQRAQHTHTQTHPASGTWFKHVHNPTTGIKHTHTHTRTHTLQMVENTQACPAMVRKHTHSANGAGYTHTHTHTHTHTQFPFSLLLLSCFSHVWLCATLETAARQAHPSLGFSRQEYWSGVPLGSPDTTCTIYTLYVHYTCIYFIMSHSDFHFCDFLPLSPLALSMRWAHIINYHLLQSCTK